jgi:hypothetical protein
MPYYSYCSFANGQLGCFSLLAAMNMGVLISESLLSSPWGAHLEVGLVILCLLPHDDFFTHNIINISAVNIMMQSDARFQCAEYDGSSSSLNALVNRVTLLFTKDSRRLGIPAEYSLSL